MSEWTPERIAAFRTRIGDRTIRAGQKLVKESFLTVGNEPRLREEMEAAANELERLSNLKVIDILNSMTDEERYEIISQYCKHCGSKDINCQCWNDE